LYVAGQAPRYEAAHLHLKKLCEENFAGNYVIEIVDLLEHPEQARTDNVIAIPMLVRVSPEPAIRIIGDLSDTQKVLNALGAVR
jgi:circadian clock protein KaiB